MLNSEKKIRAFRNKINQTLVLSEKKILDETKDHNQGRIQGGDALGARPAPRLKLEKIWFFGRKTVIFHTKSPKNFGDSLSNWKKYDFLS